MDPRHFIEKSLMTAIILEEDINIAGQVRLLNRIWSKYGLVIYSDLNRRCVLELFGVYLLGPDLSTSCHPVIFQPALFAPINIHAYVYIYNHFEGKEIYI